VPGVEIRPADRGDTRFLAWVMQAAARSHLPRGIWDVAIPDARARLDYLDALLGADTISFCHHSRFLVAEIDGRQAAALSAYEPAHHVEALDAASQEARARLGWGEREERDLARNMRPIAGAFPELPPERWVVEWVAALPEHRGRGLASRLLDAILERGRAHGYRLGQIALLIGNLPAQRVYERHGFKIVDEKRDPGFEAALGCPGIARMHGAL
jgi:translation initiation factor 4G